jgi:elongation factor Tu
LLIPVENVHFLQGRGALATGRIERGVVKIGDTVEIVGLRDTGVTRVSGVESLGAWVDEGRAGDIVGLLLPATPVEEIERGQVIALPESVKAHARFEATVFLLGPEEGVGQADVLSRYFEFQFRTARVRGGVTLPEGVDNVLPGDVTPLSVELMAPVVMTQGSRFLIRKAARIVGAGTVSGAG